MTFESYTETCDRCGQYLETIDGVTGYMIRTGRFVDGLPVVEMICRECHAGV